MDEVTTMSVGAKTFVEETEARFCFVGSVIGSVASEFLGSVGELAALSVGTGACHHEVFAE